MKNKLNLLILILICSMLVSSIIGIDRVLADILDDYVEGGGAEIGGCGSGNCYAGNVGFRVTLVNATTGERCNYDSTTKTLCGETGSPTVSEDYWFNKPTNDTVNKKKLMESSDDCWAYSTKQTKLEYLGSDKTLNIKNYCKESNTPSFKTINDVFSTYVKNNWTSHSKYIESSKIPQNMTDIKNWFAGRLESEITTELDIILKTLTKDSNVNATNVSGIENVTIQFEQLLEIVNYDKNTAGNPINVIMFYGTVAETSYLYDNQVTSVDKALEYSRACTYNKIILKKDAVDRGWEIGDIKQNTEDGNVCHSYMYNGGYWTGWHGDKILGDLNAVTDQTVKDRFNSETFKRDTTDISYFYSTYDTANLFNVKIIEHYDPYDCDDYVEQFYEKKVDEDLDWQAFYKLLADNDYTDHCVTLVDGQYKVTEACAVLDSFNLGLYSNDLKAAAADSIDGKICSKTVCNNQLSQIQAITSSDKNNKQFIDLAQKLYDYWLALTGKKHSLLLSNIYNALNESPACSDEVPQCNPTIDAANCSTGDNGLVFADNKTCVQMGNFGDKYDLGIAYTDPDVKTALQTSYDSEYSSGENKGYCYEEVSFDLPTSVNDVNNPIKAGTTFKWGINGNNDNKDDNLFGKMIVKRVCYVPEGTYNTTNDIVTSDWADIQGDTTPVYNGSEEGRINPLLKVTYKEALPSNIDGYVANNIVEKTLDVNLYTFDMDIYTYENNQYVKYVYDNAQLDSNDFVINYNDESAAIHDFNYVNYEQYAGKNPRKFTCGVYCNQIRRIDMVATYKLTYGNDFKWYSDKSNNDKYVTETSIGNQQNNPAYIYVGYGMPTSFITPTNLKLGEGESYGYETDNGELSVDISQIGTLNEGTTDEYHFDKLLNFTTEDSNDNNIVEYNCGFNIKNYIQGNEDGNDPPPDEPPKGLDVVFRTVQLVSSTDELDKAFPGRSGNGINGIEGSSVRGIGENWDKISDDLITQILSVNVYNQESPMYYIKLDVPMIKKIREWNQQARDKGIDPYTDMTKVDNSNMTNAGLTGYYYSTLDGTIRSRFLTILYNEYNSKFDSICISQGSDESKNNRVKYCNQSWWNETEPNSIN